METRAGLFQEEDLAPVKFTVWVNFRLRTIILLASFLTLSLKAGKKVSHLHKFMFYAHLKKTGNKRLTVISFYFISKMDFSFLYNNFIAFYNSYLLKLVNKSLIN